MTITLLLDDEELEQLFEQYTSRRDRWRLVAALVRKLQYEFNDTGDPDIALAASVSTTRRNATSATVANAWDIIEYDASTPFTVDIADTPSNTAIHFFGAGNLTINPFGSQMIDGESTKLYSGEDDFTIIREGTNWITIRSKSDLPLGAVTMNVIMMSLLGLINSGADEPADAVAPTVQSITINAATPNRATIALSEACNIADVTGLGFAEAFGPTITSIISGNGTSSIVVGLSLDWYHSGYALTFEYDGTNTIADLASNPLAAGSTAVTYVGTFPNDVLDAFVAEYDGFWFWAGDAVVTSSPDIDSIPMAATSGGTFGAVAQGTADAKPHLAMLNGRPHAHFDGVDDFLVSGSSVTEYNFMHRAGGCSVYTALTYHDVATIGHPIATAGGNASENGFDLQMNHGSDVVAASVADGDAGDYVFQCVASGNPQIAPETAMVISVTWDEAAGGDLQINGGAPASNGPNEAPDTDANATASLTIGKYPGFSLQYSNMHMAIGVIVKTIPDLADHEAASAAAAAFNGATLL